MAEKWASSKKGVAAENKNGNRLKSFIQGLNY